MRELITSFLALNISLKGSAGQSFRRLFYAKALKLKLFGDANDYVAKGLSGGKIVNKSAFKRAIIS